MDIEYVWRILTWGLIIIVGWFTRMWVNDMKAELKSAREEISALNERVSYLEGRGGSRHSDRR